MNKIQNAIKHISVQKMALKYSEQEQEIWRALHQAQEILDKAFLRVVKG